MNFFKVFSIFLIFFLLYFISADNAFSKDINDYLKEIKTDIKIKDEPLKLKNGEVLFGIYTIFNPQNNSFRKTKQYDKDITFQKKVELNNGNILLINSEHLPSNILLSNYGFRKKLKKKVLNDYVLENCDIPKKYMYINGEKIEVPVDDYVIERKIKDLSIKKIYNDYWIKFNSLSEKEKEEIIYPVIKEDSKLLERYQKCIKAYKEAENVYIFNTKTEELEFAGKRNINEKISTVIPLKDGRVLFVYNNDYSEYEGDKKTLNISKLEIYNPETKNSQIVKNKNQIYIGNLAMVLDDGRIYLNYRKRNFILYNPVTDDIERIEELDKSYLICVSNDKHLILSDSNTIYNFNPKDNTIKKFPNLIPNGLITIAKSKNSNNIYFYDNSWHKKIYVYDIDKNTIKLLCNTHTHGTSPILVNDKFLLFYGGRIYYIDGTSNPDFRIELLNIKTGKTRIIGNAKEVYPTNPLVYDNIELNDGRYLIRFGYTPYILEISD